jgi:hypothetical protein
MHAAMKLAWVKTLREAPVPQGKGLLYNSSNGSYDPIGVLCRLASTVYYNKDSDAFYHERSKFPMKIRINKKMSECYHLSFENEKHILKMNDEGKSFSEIADWIEENL